MKEELIRQAHLARKNAYTPYSNFAVGAALLCESGKIFSGCNVENGAYTPTCCAERVALFKAISEGERNFAAIAVVGGKTDGDTDILCPPCGVCRQVLAEFCDDDFAVYLRENGKTVTWRLGDLLPNRFHL